MGAIAGILVLLSAVIWVGLLTVWGQFWRADQRLGPMAATAPVGGWPRVWAIVPARNEATVLPESLASLLQQDYPGELRVVVVNDHSTDGTAAVARQVAADLHQTARLAVVDAAPLPAGWAGKLWAVAQGVDYVATQAAPEWLWLTDADIAHGPDSLRQLVAKAEAEQRDLVSLMVQLRCASFWERLLIPAFVFFFQLLYPFPWVNDPRRQMAAAAGGCILLRRTMLAQMGGIGAVRNALIDDCALGQAVKAQGGNLWLGLTQDTVSLRPYTTLQSIWDMVARSAYTQLHYSPWLLVGTLVGLGLVYGVPPLGVLVGLAWGQWWLSAIALLTWGLMTLAYWPTVRWYGLSVGWAIALPVIALLYGLMTLDSAWRHWRGRGGVWKGRVYG